MGELSATEVFSTPGERPLSQSVATSGSRANTLAVPPSLQSIPGFSSIQYVVKRIIITNTALENFTGTLGIFCPPPSPGAIEFSYNDNLVSFAGLATLYPPLPGSSPPSVYADYNPQLADISAISYYARCAVQPLDGEVRIVVSPCTSDLYSYDDVCNYIDAGTCPGAPTPT